MPMLMETFAKGEDRLLFFRRKSVNFAKPTQRIDFKGIHELFAG